MRRDNGRVSRHRPRARGPLGARRRRLRRLGYRPPRRNRRRECRPSGERCDARRGERSRVPASRQTPAICRCRRRDGRLRRSAEADVRVSVSSYATCVRSTARCRGRLRAPHRTPGRELRPRDTHPRYVTSRRLRLSRARGQSRGEHDLRGNDRDSVTGARRAPSGHPAVSRKSTQEPSAPMSTMAPRRTSAEYSLPGFRQSVCPIFCAPRDSWMWPCSPTDGW